MFLEKVGILDSRFDALENVVIGSYSSFSLAKFTDKNIISTFKAIKDPVMDLNIEGVKNLKRVVVGVFQRYNPTGHIMMVDSCLTSNYPIVNPFLGDANDKLDVTHRVKDYKFFRDENVQFAKKENVTLAPRNKYSSVIAHLPLKWVKDLSPTATYWLLQKDYTVQSITYADIISEYGTKYKYIGDDGYKTYNNSSDGRYSTGNPREMNLPGTLLMQMVSNENIVDNSYNILYNADTYLGVNIGSFFYQSRYNLDLIQHTLQKDRFSWLGYAMNGQTMETFIPFLATVKLGYFPATLIKHEAGRYEFMHIGVEGNFVDMMWGLGIKSTCFDFEAKDNNTSRWLYKPWNTTEPGSGGQPGGETGGGTGTGDTGTEEVTGGVSRTGTSELVTSYAMKFTEVEELQSAFIQGSLWTNPSAYFKDEQSALVNMLRFPFDLKNLDSSSMTFESPINVMGIPMEWTGGKVTGNRLHADMLTQIYMGDLDFAEFFGSFLDYDPYTKINIYLPYIGFKQVSANAVMGKHVQILYNVSYLDGTCMAIIKVNDIPMYTVEGRLGYQVPLTKSDTGDIIQGAIRTGIGALAVAGVGLATGGAGAAAAVGVASTTSLITKESSASIVGNAAANTVGSLLQKSTTTVSGTAQGVHARAMSNIPFAIVERPITNMPLGYGKIAGFQTNLYIELSKCEGMTVCENIKLDGFGYATESEKDEIKMLLSRGVIL